MEGFSIFALVVLVLVFLIIFARKDTETVCYLPLGGRELLAQKEVEGLARGFSFLRRKNSPREAHLSKRKQMQSVEKAR
jgi:hypothetical protein